MNGFSRIAALSVMFFTMSGMSGCHAQSADTGTESQPARPDVSEAGLKQVPLTITSKNKTHRFMVELAQTVEQQARGLMFRTSLGPDNGMIFPFTDERIASFWMKNTVISLDIIFVRKDGTIESVAANTTPYSLDPVRSGEPVAAVLELAGGRAADLGIAAGDKVVWAQ